MASDIHGNPLSQGDKVYIMAAANGGSKSMRLLYGEVTKTTDRKAEIYIYENSKVYSKTSATIVKPLET